MRILFDTNVVLDLLLDRKPFVEQAQVLFDKVEANELKGYLGATTITTLDYLLHKALSAQEATQTIKSLLKLFEISPVNRLVLENALNSRFLDFEDAVLHASAIHADVQAIVTRDEKGFRNAQLPVYSPEALLNALPVHI